VNEEYLKKLLIALAEHLHDSCENFLKAAADPNLSNLRESQEFETLSLSLQHLSYILNEVEKIDESVDEIQELLGPLSIDLNEQ